MRISSDTISAHDAIAKIVDVSHGSLTNQHATLGFSNVAGMKKAVQASNQMIKDVSKLVSCTCEHAEKIPELAKIIEQRDNEDCVAW